MSFLPVRNPSASALATLTAQSLSFQVEVPTSKLKCMGGGVVSVSEEKSQIRHWATSAAHLHASSSLSCGIPKQAWLTFRRCCLAFVRLLSPIELKVATDGNPSS